jgi:hypothetical protein
MVKEPSRIQRTVELTKPLAEYPHGMTACRAIASVILGGHGLLMGKDWEKEM